MSFQMRDTVFGNNIVNIHARSGDRCAIIQICNDSGNGYIVWIIAGAAVVLCAAGAAVFIIVKHRKGKEGK